MQVQEWKLEGIDSVGLTQKAKARWRGKNDETIALSAAFSFIK